MVKDRDVYMLVWVESEALPEVYHVYGQPFYLGEDGGFRAFSDHAFGPEIQLADLRVSCQGEDGGQPYAFRTQYHQPFRVDLRRAQEMGKMLAKLEKRLMAMDAQLGNVQSFSAYMARVGLVLGVKGYFVPENRHWSNADLEFVDANLLGLKIDHALRESKVMT